MPTSPRSASARAPRVLSVGGSDPLVGAGTVADALTILEHGGLALSVLSAAVVQDSHGVRSFAPVPLPTFEASLDCALADGRPDAVKIGMVGTPAHAEALSARLAAARVVVDPVLHGGSDGTPLHRAGRRAALLEALEALLHEALVTPNADELGVWLGRPAPRNVSQLVSAAEALRERGAGAVFAKGGHLDVPGTDVLVSASGTRVFEPKERWPDPDIHGTGCALSSAIATHWARTSSLEEAVARSRDWLHAKACDPAGVIRVGSGRAQLRLGSP